MTKKLLKLGYAVAEAFTVDTDDGPVAVLHIEGHGVALYVREDDEEALASLVDADAHAERARQAESLHQETQDG